MREIKFRGWSESDNKMYHDKAHHSMSIQESGESISLSFAGDVSFEFFSNGACFMVTKNEEGYKNTDNSITPMQYIGVKDDNGIEVYEGDIIKFYRQDDYYEDEQREGYSQVVYSSQLSAFCYYYEVPDFVFGNGRRKVISTVGGIHDQCGSITVIGNIYENPELIEDD